MGWNLFGTKEGDEVVDKNGQFPQGTVTEISHSVMGGTDVAVIETSEGKKRTAIDNVVPVDHIEVDELGSVKRFWW